MPSTPASTVPLARTPEEWAAEMARLKERAFHGKQVFRWIHQRGVTDAAAMTDLPATLRAKLAEEGLQSVLDVVTERRAADDTRKLLVALGDGANVETVLIPRRPKVESEDADAAAVVEDEEELEATTEGGSDTAPILVTQCISTQVGCAMGCVFCASGVAGLKRHMRPDEIVAQVLVGRSRLDAREQLRNVVLMGMGEPLHNYDSTVRALRLLTHKEGIALSPRKVTVSTSGLVPEIAKLGEDFGGQIGLAISLHAADDETRTRLMPINKKYPLAKLMEALRAYPLPKRRKITIEYTLVAGKNDTIDEAKKLARLLTGLPVKINLIPMNPIEASTLGPTSMNGVHAFQRVLTDAGYACFIRKRRGDDVSAACGQLALLGAKPKVRVNRG
jgi:23S rRNA (adenine2503-C2)-methyltransferase